MCGIVGLFLKDKSLEPELGSLLTDMLVTMSDRGPDSAGIAIYNNSKKQCSKITIQSMNPVEDFKEIKAHLLIEVDGYDDDAVLKEAEKVGSVLEENGAFNVLFAQTSKERDALWKLRRRVGEAVKSKSIYKEEDTVVPRSKLPELLRVVKSVGKEFNFKTVCYGHAGDGNLHVNILKGDMSDEQWNGEHLKTGIRKIFEAVKSMGGTISGEHGIGLVQKIYLDVVFNQIEIQVQKSIKNVFDPLGIMNPGKIFLDKTN